ncbi:MAG: hypothetical protein HUU34_04885 [Saprospiraceae bacterium]|jgi:hypothetical protein|nr:hypothetical protein [Saprospiraceae bacterium]
MPGLLFFFLIKRKVTKEKSRLYVFLDRSKWQFFVARPNSPAKVHLVKAGKNFAGLKQGRLATGL